MKKYIILSTLFVLLAVLLISVQARTWKAGTFSVEGEYAGMTDDGTKVRIKKTSDGKHVKIALENLSKEDQEFVKGQNKRSGIENPFEDDEDEENADAPATPVMKIPQENWYAFIVGVNTYPDRNFGDLRYCVSDATALVEKFKELGFPEKNIRLIVDSVNIKQQPTKENIEEQLEIFASNLPDNSLVIFSFAGHGIELDGKGACIVPTDVDSDHFEDTVISAQDVASRLEKSKAQVKLMLVDACRSKTRGTKNLRGFKMDPPKGLAFLQSCSPEEATYEDNKTEHGYFTLTFLEALDGKADENNDGIVTLSEIFSYTGKQTEARVKKYELGAIQRPFYSFNGVTVQDFPMVTGLLVDGLTKEQRDEAEGYYNEAEEAFDNSNYTLAQEKINKALGIYGSNEKYKKLANTIDKMVKAEAEQQRLAEEKRLAEQKAQAEAEARKQAEEEKQAALDAQKKAEEQARLAKQRPTSPSVTPSTTYTTPSSSSGRKAGDRMVKTVNGVEFAFRWCPAGTFMMGSPTSEEGRFDDETRHRVTLTKGFWMMETEVTQKQWKAIMGTNPSIFKGDDLPVEEVSWNDCQEFCKKCADLGLLVCLPTEAQWEYACRAGSTTAYFWGNSLNGDKANCDGRYPCGTTTKGLYLDKTAPVKSYSSNAWGLYDMHGNVREWCADWYTKDHYGDDATDPIGPSSGSNRVYRGGSWYRYAQVCRSARRDNFSPERRFYDLGFRVALRGQ